MVDMWVETPWPVDMAGLGPIRSSLIRRVLNPCYETPTQSGQTPNPKPRHSHITARVMAAAAGRRAHLPDPQREGDAAWTWNVPTTTTTTTPPTTTTNELCSNRARRTSRSVRVAHRPAHPGTALSASLRRNRPHVVPVRLLTTPDFSPFPSSVSTQRGPANGREWELCTSAYPGDEPLASLHRADAPSTWRRAQCP
jgi:hypothetical protein